MPTKSVRTSPENKRCQQRQFIFRTGPGRRVLKINSTYLLCTEKVAYNVYNVRTLHKHMYMFSLFFSSEPESDFWFAVWLVYFCVLCECTICNTQRKKRIPTMHKLQVPILLGNYASKLLSRLYKMRATDTEYQYSTISINRHKISLSQTKLIALCHCNWDILDNGILCQSLVCHVPYQRRMKIVVSVRRLFTQI